MDLTTCPDCGALAEVLDRFVLESTDGPIDHARVRCVRGHWFLLPIEVLARTHPRLSGRHTGRATAGPA
jgi:hypothetical protein